MSGVMAIAAVIDEDYNRRCGGNGRSRRTAVSAVALRVLAVALAVRLGEQDRARQLSGFRDRAGTDDLGFFGRIPVPLERWRRSTQTR